MSGIDLSVLFDPQAYHPSRSSLRTVGRQQKRHATLLESVVLKNWNMHLL